jgi:hypothetical protein
MNSSTRSAKTAPSIGYFLYGCSYEDRLHSPICCIELERSSRSVSFLQIRFWIHWFEKYSILLQLIATSN